MKTPRVRIWDYETALGNVHITLTKLRNPNSEVKYSAQIFRGMTSSAPSLWALATDDELEAIAGIETWLINRGALTPRQVAGLDD